jgi:hypothetical protein
LVNDDVRQQLFWMQRWREPELYPPSLLGLYSQAYVPWGVKGVYYLACQFLDPLLFSKFLAAGLFAVCCAGVYGLLRDEFRWRFAWSGCALCWCSPLFMYNISGGLARGFAAPLLILFLVCWERRRYFLLSLVLFFQALFIPYIFAVCALAFGIGWAASLCRLVDEHIPFFSPSNLLLTLGGAGVLLAWKSQMSSYGFGPLVTGKALLEPEFSALGRFPIYPPAPIWRELIQPFDFLLPFRDYGVVAGVGAFGLLFVGFLLTKGWRVVRFRITARLGLPLSCLVASSVILYCLARLFLLRFFIPSRYISYSWEVILILALATALGSYLSTPRVSRLGVALLLSLAFAVGMVRNYGEGLKDYSAGADLYTAVRKLPTSTVLFGNPSVLDNVLTFGRRNVYATYELAHPWNTGYWELYEKRLDDSFRYYYSNDRQAVADFCRKHSLDYIVVDLQDFSGEGEERPFFEPFDSLIGKLKARGGPYALAEESPFQVVWRDAHYVLFKVGAVQ